MLKDRRFCLRFMIGCMWSYALTNSPLSAVLSTPNWPQDSLVHLWSWHELVSLHTVWPFPRNRLYTHLSCFCSSQGREFKQAIIPNSKRFGCWFVYASVSSRSIGSSQNNRKGGQLRSFDPLEWGDTWKCNVGTSCSYSRNSFLNSTLRTRWLFGGRVMIDLP